MIKDHQDSVAHFHEVMDQERERLSSTHQAEVTKCKSETEAITADLTDKITKAEAALVTLAAEHRKTIETLTSEKDTLIKAAETRLSEREKELQVEIIALTDAVGKAQAKMMVFHSYIELIGRKFRRLQMQTTRNLNRTWRCVPGDQSLPKV